MTGFWSVASVRVRALPNWLAFGPPPPPPAWVRRRKRKYHSSTIKTSTMTHVTIEPIQAGLGASGYS